MKTYKNLFDKVCSFDNLYRSYLDARKCRRYRNYVLDFTWHFEKNLLELQNQLLDQTYCHGGYNEFIVHDAKKRHIKAAPFRDRIVHHAVCNVIEPILDKGFIYDSYACRGNKGTHKAIGRLEKFIRRLELRSKDDERVAYCLQCDISKYFDNVDHQILKALLEKKIKDEKVVWLLDEIIGSSSNLKFGKDLFDSRKVGIPIGNLTSQLFANLYLNELDQFVKHQLREKYYLRYMDDFLILGFNKERLRQVKESISVFLRDKLNLTMHPKKVNIYPVDTGIDFLGYRIWTTHRLLRKSTVKRFIKRTRKYKKEVQSEVMDQASFNSSLQSWRAYAQHGDSWRLRERLSEILEVDLFLWENSK